jgi:hypothetical protein
MPGTTRNDPTPPETPIATITAQIGIRVCMNAAEIA